VGRRATILSVCILCGFATVMVRLAEIMVINHESYLAKARSQQIRKEAFPVKRGLIVDRRGRELAVNIDTESIFCDPSEVTDPDSLASALSPVIRQREQNLVKKASSDGRFAWIERKMTAESVQRVKEMKLSGVGFMSEPKRLYPKGSLASQVIGFVDVDNRGLEGVEQAYERYLTTRGESTYVYRDARGNLLTEGTSREIRGNNVVLTLDEGLQYIVEKNLDAAILEWRASSATAVMIDPHTGEVLALANRPTFDLNSPGGAKPQQRRNRALTDCYEPGSTFKIIVGSAALEEAIVKPDMKFDCSAGSIEVGGRRIKDAHRHGVLSFREVIQKSSNVGSIKIGLMVGKERMYEYIRRFGFGQRTGIDLAGEVSGQVRPAERWSGMSIGAISIGQEVSITPLQLVRAYSVIANGGYLVKPHVVSQVMASDGRVLYKAAQERKKILSDRTIDTFREILTTVTEQGGTALAAAVDGNQVAGKTGTAQMVDPLTKRYSRDRFVSSFVGFVPADDPKIALVVVIHEPRGQIYGGLVAAPVFKKIASESLSYLSVPRDDYQERGLLLVSNR